tara:strand:- start:225 stop:524 length:300 start_codon:yes stop_codon:yes gene_type:complete
MKYMITKGPPVDGECTGETIGVLELEPGRLKNHLRTIELRGDSACCAHIENMNINQLDAKIGEQIIMTMKNEDFQGKVILGLGGDRCPDTMDISYKISQ